MNIVLKNNFSFLSATSTQILLISLSEPIAVINWLDSRDFKYTIQFVSESMTKYLRGITGFDLTN